MKTSQEWWDEVKASPEKTLDWLKKQYVGEITAMFRVSEFSLKFSKDRRSTTTLLLISTQEGNHADWIRGLLEARGVNIASVTHENKRYWNEALKGIEGFDTGCAVAAHAEAMRLERIRVICDDESAPADIRAVFQKILPEEIWHEKAFRTMSTPEAMETTRDNHEAGMAALGLVV